VEACNIKLISEMPQDLKIKLANLVEFGFASQSCLTNGFKGIQSSNGIDLSGVHWELERSLE
jgi:hypothetical protein